MRSLVLVLVTLCFTLTTACDKTEGPSASEAESAAALEPEPVTIEVAGSVPSTSPRPRASRRPGRASINSAPR